MTENQRRLKKISIVTLVLAFISVIVWLLLPSKEEGLCFNGVRDVIEEGIDCGGPCEKQCPPPPKPPQVEDIKIEWVKFVKDGDEEYDLAAKLVNNNASWGVSSVNYEFVVYDEENNLAGSVKGQTYIMPKGFVENKNRKYVIEKSIIKNHLAGYVKIKKVDFLLSDFNWVEFKNETELREKSQMIIKITDESYGYVKNGKEFYCASGVTRNLSRYSFYRVDINVILFNNKDEPIAVGKTDQWTMGAEEGWIFEIFWLNPFSEEVSRAEYEVGTNVFDIDNFMAEYGTGNRYKIPR